VGGLDGKTSTFCAACVVVRQRFDKQPLNDLPLNEILEHALDTSQFGVSAVLHHTAAGQHVNMIGVEDGAEAMGDDDARGLQGLKALADNCLGAVIEGAGGFVEEQDARAVGDGPDNEEPLTLAFGECGRSFANDDVHAYGHEFEVGLQPG